MLLKKRSQQQSVTNLRVETDKMSSLEISQVHSEVDFNQTINEIEEAAKELRKSVKIKKLSLEKTLNHSSYIIQHPFLKLTFPRSFIIGLAV